MGGIMIYVFFSAVLITLFIFCGAWSLLGFIELMQKHMPLTWLCYQHVIVLAALAVLFFIAAVICGTQIPECYVP